MIKIEVYADTAAEVRKQMLELLNLDASQTIAISISPEATMDEVETAVKKAEADAKAAKVSGKATKAPPAPATPAAAIQPPGWNPVTNTWDHSQAPNLQFPVQQAIPVPQAAPAPVQVTIPVAAQTYSLDQLAVAATQLMDAGRQPELLSLLSGFGVAAMTQLSKDQYGAFATSLRQLGAKI